MDDTKDPLGHDPLQGLEHDSLWTFDPAAAPPVAPGLPAPRPAPAASPSPPARSAKTPPLPQAHHLVTFTVGPEFFGIDIKSIQEIIRHKEVCPVPNAPPYMEGLINVRGRILPVMSLKKRMGMSHSEESNIRHLRVIIVSSRGNPIGMMVDSVKEVMHIPLNIVDPPTTLATGGAAEYMLGVAKLEDRRLLIILNLEKLLAEL